MVRGHGGDGVGFQLLCFVEARLHDGAGVGLVVRHRRGEDYPRLAGLRFLAVDEQSNTHPYRLFLARMRLRISECGDFDLSSLLLVLVDVGRRCAL